MEKTFEELIEKYAFYDRSDYAKKEPLLDKADVLQLLQQVREATIAEIENKANEYGEIAIADYVSDMPTDRIKLTDENRKGD